MLNLENFKTASKRQLFNCILACVLTVAFVVWTGYWITLLMIIVFIDIYITKNVPWGTWRKSENKSMQSVLDWVDAIVFALVGVWFLNSFFFQNYQIPSSSLEKSLLVGDYLCVSKLSYGGRSPMTLFTLPLMQHTIPVLNTKSYLEKPQLEYKRFAGTGSIHRSDIVVFNYPAGDTVALNRQNEDYYKISHIEGRAATWANKEQNGAIVFRPVDRRENYVKRCLGLPGEKIRLSNDSVFVNDEYIKGAENEQYMYHVQTDGTELSAKLFSDLGVSLEDQRLIGRDAIQNLDSIQLSQIGLAYNNGKPGILYQQIFLTQAMCDELDKKPFVLNVIRYNAYQKLLGKALDRKLTQLVYPFGYDNQCEYGDFPETWIPKAGETIVFDNDVDRKFATYSRCIKNYENNDLEYKDGKIFINGIETDRYTFQLDYYFMMGDNRDNSADSRSWGFVPEDHIVGKPLFVWLSINPDKGWFDGRIRWNRLFTSGNKQ